MKIEQDRQLLIFLRGMQEGVRYIPTEKFWERYQNTRVASGWTPTTASRDQISLRREGKVIFSNRVVLVRDLDSPPDDLAFALAFADGTFTFALAFAFAFRGALAFAFTPAGQPNPPKDTFQAEVCLDNFRALPGPAIQGDHSGFYREGPAQQSYGEIEPPEQSAGEIKINLALHGLTESQAAQILAILGDPQ
jgi:hypothetical protein